MAKVARLKPVKDKPVFEIGKGKPALPMKVAEDFARKIIEDQNRNCKKSLKVKYAEYYWLLIWHIDDVACHAYYKVEGCNQVWMLNTCRKRDIWVTFSAYLPLSEIEEHSADNTKMKIA